VTGLDTNILARFFLQDDPLQSPQADKVISSLSPKEKGWVGLTTILELVWVLSRQNHVDRKGITIILSQLVSREEIEIEQSIILQTALQLYRRGNADFADCLIACSALAAGCSRILTFDRRAARDAGMELIE
jgi:predicted nucleic-acid-binding protein